MSSDKIIFLGTGVGEVVASGQAFFIKDPDVFVTQQKSALSPANESARLARAVAQVTESLSQAIHQTSAETSEILNALLSLLLDKKLQAGMQLVIEAGWSSESSVSKVFADYANLLSEMGELKEDFLDLGRQIQSELAGTSELVIPTEHPVIVIAKNLSPLQTVKLAANVVGVILLESGPTSHTAIICRQKEIATLVGAEHSSLAIESDEITVDSIAGIAYLGSPIGSSAKTAARKIIGEPLVKLRLNIGAISDLKSVSPDCCDGIGLVRTEMFFLEAMSEPNSMEQTKVYETILRLAGQGRIVFRTFDTSADKPLTFINSRNQLSLWNSNQYWEIIENQLASLALAQKIVGREVSVMAPMIENADQAEEFVGRAKNHGIHSAGVMVELPTLSLEIPKLLGKVDFLSIGTNDLAKYLFGLDRENVSSSNLLNPWNPELLKRVKVIAEAANSIGVEVAVCGEAAADPLLGVVFAGIGIDALSMARPAIPRALEYLSSITADQAKEIAGQALAQSDAEAAKAVTLENLVS